MFTTGLSGENRIDVAGARRIGIRGGHTGPVCTRSHRNDGSRFVSAVSHHVECGASRELHAWALLLGGDRSLNHPHELAGVVGHGLGDRDPRWTPPDANSSGIPYA
jgi:hypothetical protein